MFPGRPLRAASSLFFCLKPLWPRVRGAPTAPPFPLRLPPVWQSGRTGRPTGSPGTGKRCGAPSIMAAMDARLDQARQLLEMGQVEEARGSASGILKEAEERGDRALQGQALLTLALFDRVLGRFRRAAEAAQKAVHLF